jgi:hypothetical protein
MGNINNGVLDGVRRIGAKIRDLTVDGGLPGAPLGLRIRGATASGYPTTGTWKAGDVIEDRTGGFYICTGGGSGPVATWAVLSSSPYALAAAPAQACGLTGWSSDTFTWVIASEGVTVNGTAAAGRMAVTFMPVGPNWVINYIVALVDTAGSGLTSGECFGALYGTAGNLLGQTLDQSTAWATTGPLAMAVQGGPYTGTAPGLVAVGVWYNGTTSPKFPVENSAVSALVSAPAYMTGSGVNRSGFNTTTGLTTTAPASLGTLKTLQNGDSSFAFAVSATINSALRTS